MWMTRRPIVCEDAEDNFWQLVSPYLPMSGQGRDFGHQSSLSVCVAGRLIKCPSYATVEVKKSGLHPPSVPRLDRPYHGTAITGLILGYRVSCWADEQNDTAARQDLRLMCKLWPEPNALLSCPGAKWRRDFYAWSGHGGA
ncbi:unnamed protein product [Pleuronectes platessa]|uniref:Uncharacterized protein n=1 Tax=Pleuronectes platessa TaxID=8262 RepID=A0A9N7VRN3_PLEPL|nr:unnamed protein product [Pleuronectes platessa]